VTEKLHVDLSGAPQTMLATFYAKALDADLPKPILGDRYAKDIVDRIDYDWKKTAITATNSAAVTTRSAHFDRWARQFLAVHPEAVVLHLGCGLDARFFRLDPGPGVEWYDVDYPDVADLRRQLYPTRDHYHVVAASVTDPVWLQDIPADRPVLAIGEGLTMYLTQADGVGLLRRIVENCNSTRSTGWASDRSGPIRWCGARGPRCIGASTDPATSSTQYRECGCSPGCRLSRSMGSRRCPGITAPRYGQ
jgi:O-methyltransferase involved in polyketide biosynthesis